jgi:two-component system nitrate/nitrite response regulator NarL
MGKAAGVNGAAVFEAPSGDGASLAMRARPLTGETSADTVTPALTAPHRTRLILIGGPPLYLEALGRSLGAYEHLEVVGFVSATDHVAAELVRSLEADVALVNLSMVDPAAALGNLLPGRRGTKLVALGVENTAACLAACARAGVTGYLDADSTVPDLVDALTRVSRGELVCHPHIAEGILRCIERGGQEIAPDSSPSELTQRERQVADLIAVGLTNKEIAERLVIELPTVKSHVHNILTKLNVHRRSEAAYICLGAGGPAGA